MPKHLPELEIEPQEKAKLPLGYSKVFFKKIFPDALERKLKFYSKKYNKLDFLLAGSQKPISKIITYKKSKNESED